MRLSATMTCGTLKTGSGRSQRMAEAPLCGGFQAVVVAIFLVARDRDEHVARLHLPPITGATGGAEFGVALAAQFAGEQFAEGNSGGCKGRWRHARPPCLQRGCGRAEKVVLLAASVRGWFAAKRSGRIIVKIQKPVKADFPS